MFNSKNYKNSSNDFDLEELENIQKEFERESEEYYLFLLKSQRELLDIRKNIYECLRN